jgi:hypothetical protein
MRDRRICPRWEVNRSIKIKFEEALAFMDAILVDINFKGARICLKQLLPVDKFLKVSIMLTDDLVINVETWCTWQGRLTEANEYGLYFTKISSTDKETLYHFIGRNYADLIRKNWFGESPPEKAKTKFEKGGETMEKQSFEDRRIFARIPVDTQVRYLDLGTNYEGQARAKDISAKGIGMISKENLTPNTSLELWIDMPDKGEPLYTRGEVVWSKAIEDNYYRVGINLEKADLMGISRFIRAAS